LAITAGWSRTLSDCEHRRNGTKVETIRGRGECAGGA